MVVFRALIVIISIAFAFTTKSIGQTAPEFTSVPVETSQYGSSYTYSITTSDLEGNSRSIALENGSLPPGLNLIDNMDGTALLSGTPNLSGLYIFEIGVTDADGTTLQEISLDVGKAPLIATADDKTKIYGSANPVLTISYTGFVNGDDSNAITGPTITTTANTGSDVGSYPIELAGGSATNYTLTFNDGNLSITPAALGATADDKTKIYGSANPVLTISYTGFVNGDDSNAITEPTITTTANTGSDVGSYPIELADGSATNYTLTLNDGNLSITPAALGVTADDKTKIYGSANPVLTISYTGFVNGDDSNAITEPTITTTANTGSDVGNYPIELAGGTASNYALTLTNGVLSITKATLTATADDKSRVYNTSNPAFTVSYSGFVNGDDDGILDILPVGATTATQFSNVGSYLISLSGAFDNNYTFNYLDGTLTIAKATSIVTVNDITFTYDGTSKAATALTTPPGLTVLFTYDGSSTAPRDAGTYSVEGTVDDINYEGIGSGTLTINKATALLSISDLYQNFDGSPKPVMTTTTPAGLNTEVTYNGNSSVPSAIGTYNVVATVLENNYLGTDTEILIINGAPSTTGISDIFALEDASNSTINLHNSFSDVEDTDADLTYSITANSNPGLFNQVSINSETLTLDYSANQFGSADVTVRATDTGGLFVETSFEVNVSPVQDDPEFVSSPVTGAIQDQLYQYDISVLDPDPGDVLTIVSSLQLPAWLNLTDNGDGTALLSGTPSNSEVGSNPGIALSVDDGKGNDDSQLFNIIISNANDAPYFTSTAIETATEGITYTYFINTDDDDAGDDLTLSAPTLPGWLTLTDNGDGSGQITGTPSNDDVGPNIVQLSVADNSNALTTQDFTIEVENANDAPSINSTPVTSVDEDNFYEYNIISSDPDMGDILELRVLSIPSWLTLVDNGDGTGNLSGTPANDNVGVTSIVINVEDQDGANSNQNFTLTVNNVNDQPVFTSNAVTAALQDNLYTYNITTSDPDAGDTRDITATQLPGWLNLQDNGNGTATLSGTPDNGDLGSNSVTLAVTDQNGLFTLQPFTINVDNANDPPSFTSNPITSGTEDQLYTYNIATTDPDAGDTRVITALSIPTWLSLIDNGDGTAIISGIPLNQNVGNVSIVLNVRDALGANVNQNFTLNISNTNDDPIFQSTPITAAVQSITYNYNVSADDPDAGDDLTLTALTLPSWLNFTDNGNGSGILMGTPSNGNLGNHSVSIKAMDNIGGDAIQDFTINVDNSNDPPAFTSSPITLATEDEPYLYNIAVTDPDVGDVLDIEALVIPGWLNFVDNGDGSAEISGTPLNSNVGIADVVLEVKDAQGVSVNQNFSINVTNTNDPPVFSSSPITGAIQDQTYIYNIVTSDPDLNDSRSISASIKPTWLTITDNGNGTALIQGIPTNTNLGSNNVILEVSDLAGAITTQSYVINVDNTNDPPSFTSIPVTTATEDQLYEYTVTTSDPDAGDTRTISALSLPEWLTLSDNGDGTGLLSGIPLNEHVGNVTVVLNVVDGIGSNVNQNFTLNVSNTNDPPFFSSSPVPVAVQDLEYVYNITTGDPDAADTRDITATTLPVWLTFTDNGNGTATLSGTASNANLGEHQVILNVEDESQAAVDQVFTINVDNANDAPLFESTPVTSVLEDNTYSYSINTSDPDLGDVQIITTLSKPNWLNLTDNGDGTALLTGIPRNEDVGIANVVLNVEDGIGANVNQSFNITVTNTNDAPGFISSPVTGAIQDVQYNYNIQTVDPDNNDIVSITPNSLPTWASLTDNGDGSGLLQGTPSNSNLGLNSVSIKVTDIAGASVNQVFDINVDNQNDSPSFTSSPITSAQEDMPYTYNITTSDPDVGDTREINALSVPDWLSLTDNGDGTAMIQGTPLNVDVGSSNVVLQVVDALGSEDGQSFTMTVENTNDPPSFNSSPVTNVQQGLAYTYNITTTDPDANDTRSIFIAGRPNWLIFTDNGNGTASLSGTPTNADLGDYDIILTVEDAAGVAVDQVFTLIVDNTNDPPIFDSAPITSINEDELYEYSILTSDPDADENLVITALSKPSWLNFVDNGDDTALLSGIPNNNNVGVHNISLQVKDLSNQTTEQNFELTVVNENDAPIFNSIGVTEVLEDELYTYNVSATDVDAGDILQFSADLIPDWLSFTDNGDGTGLLHGTPENEDVGTTTVILLVEDIAGAKGNQEFELTIINTNDAPEITSTPVEEVFEDTSYEYLITSTDPDIGDSFTFTSNNSLDWLDLIDNGDGTALLAGTPVNENVGTVNVDILVTDASGAEDGQDFQIMVINTNDDPVFESNPIEKVAFEENYTYNITVNDPDVGDVVTLSAPILPSYLSFTDDGNGNGIVSGTIPSTEPNEKEVTIRAKDMTDGEIDQSYTLIFNNPPLVQDFEVETDEDQVLGFSKAIFEANTTDDAGDELKYIKITQTPSNGLLRLGESEVATDQKIEQDEISDLNYLPNLNYFGEDIFFWIASDGLSESEVAAEVQVSVISINDAPLIITNKQNDILETFPNYKLGNEISIIPPNNEISINDADGDLIQSGEVAIVENYSSSDRLFIEDQDNENITVSFDPNNGILTLSGEASSIAYTSVLRQVQFTSPVGGDAILSTKKFNISVSDSDDKSNIVSRNVVITELFPPLDLVSAFTPNGDGVNDYWEILGLEVYSNILIVIYDADGNKIFECKNKDCAWDGKVGGKAMPAGPYFYTINLNDGTRNYKGTVTILK